MLGFPRITLRPASSITLRCHRALEAPCDMSRNAHIFTFVQVLPAFVKTQNYNSFLRQVRLLQYHHRDAFSACTLCSAIHRCRFTSTCTASQKAQAALQAFSSTQIVPDYLHDALYRFRKISAAELTADDLPDALCARLHAKLVRQQQEGSKAGMSQTSMAVHFFSWKNFHR